MLVIISASNLLTSFPKDVVFRDGETRQIRALQPNDQEKLKALLSRCSVESLRFRFLRLAVTMTL